MTVDLLPWLSRPYLTDHSSSYYFKYDCFDPNRNIATNSTRTRTLGANHLLKADDIKLQLNYLVSDIDGLPASSNKLILRLQTIF